MDDSALRELAKKIGDGKATGAESAAFLEAMRQEMAELKSMILEAKNHE